MPFPTFSRDPFHLIEQRTETFDNCAFNNLGFDDLTFGTTDRS